MTADPVRLRRQAADLIAQAVELELRAEPLGGNDGTVIRFTHKYNRAADAKVYPMVAMRADGLWSCTNGLGTRAVGWPTMVSRYPALAKGEYDYVAGWISNREV